MSMVSYPIIPKFYHGVRAISKTYVLIYGWIRFESSASIGSVASIATQPHPPHPQPQPVVFTVPNMNQNLHIKVSKGNFMAWKTQILAYIKA